MGPCFHPLALGHFGEDIGAAIGMIDRCLALNPSLLKVG